MKSTMFAIILVVCSIAISCNSNSHVTKQVSYEDSLQSLLIGFWGNPQEDSPVWKIDKDSIYYLQNHNAYPYKQDSNSVIISFPDHKGVLKNIYFIKDTLYFFPDDGRGGILMACRFRAKK